MQSYVAFLRGMNLGGRRITNDELCAHVRALGFEGVSAFLASGNVLFEARRGSSAQVAARVREGLEAALGYAVPTFVRTAEEVAGIAAHQPFTDDVGVAGGKLQVALLAGTPTASARAAVLDLATEADRLAFRGNELYWLPRGTLTESDLDFRAIDSALGPMTIRTLRTLERITAKQRAG